MRARDNPFRVERLHGLRPRIDVPLADLLARWESMGGRAALVGPHGTGKTTLIEALRVELGNPPLLRLSEERRRLPSELPAGTLLIDGAEQLDGRDWRKVVERPGRLLVTAHRPGLLPTLWESRSSETLLDALLEDLGAGAWRVQARPLLAAHGGNLREVFRALYDRWGEDGAKRAK